MSYYLIYPDDAKWGSFFNDDVVASYKWTMPGIYCPVCQQTWSTIGVIYPTVDLSLHPISSQLIKPRVVEIGVYEELKKTVETLVPKGLPIPPGTSFGPIIGKLTGTFGDFIWAQIWDLMIKADAYVKLTSLGLNLPVTSNPKLQQKLHGLLLQLQIEPYGQLSELSFGINDVTFCSRCQRESRKLEKVVVNQDSIPSQLDMFRIRNFPTKILVSQRFKDSVDQIELNNIRFERVDLA